MSPRPVLGPPKRPDVTLAALTAVETSPDPVEVVSAALMLHELSRRGAPVGGGFAIMGRAEPYARHVVDALAARGMLERQGRLL